MSKENTQTKSIEILTETITKPAKVEDVLTEARAKLDADDARFRLRSWDDRSVVYVPNWIVSKQEKNEKGPKKRVSILHEKGAHFGLETAEPELAERVYYDQEKLTQIDCIVGLVARIARLKEEEMKSDKDEKVINNLKSPIIDKIDKIEKMGIQFTQKQKKCFSEFSDFIDRLKSTANELEAKKDEWSQYYDYVIHIKNESDFFDKAFLEEKSPWNKEKNSEEKQEQWKQLREYLEEHRENNRIDKFISAIKDTLNRYSSLHSDYKKYIPDAESPSSEIVVPVVAFGKFIGVLNFHKEKKFSPEEEDLARKYAILLATTYLHWQSELFEKFQEVSQAVIAENNFEIIASKITDGIREGLKYGLKKNEVYPILYVPKQPVNHPYIVSNREKFDRIWKDSYQRRKRPEKPENLENEDEIQKWKEEMELWKKEQELGPIPIRVNGLGSKVIEKWAGKTKGKTSVKAEDRFKVCIDVDNPNSIHGSRSAFHHKIKTTGCLLLTFGEKIYGLLYLHCTERHFFTDTELRALNAFGIQAAVAIKNAKLIGPSYEELFGSRLLDLLERGGKK